MKFKENKFIEKFGEKIGYLFAYFLFTTILFFILRLNKLYLSYLNVMLITIIIVLFGIFIKRSLK